jgi:hypothetical protein
MQSDAIYRLNFGGIEHEQTALFIVKVLKNKCTSLLVEHVQLSFGVLGAFHSNASLHL